MLRLSTLVLGVCLSATSFATEPTNIRAIAAASPAVNPALPQITRPMPIAAPAAQNPATTISTANAAAPAGAPDMVTLQYPNSDVVDVLHLYEQLAGKKLVMDNFVQGKVNIFISKPVPREEAIKIIQINLLLNGYSLVPGEGDIVKVIGTGKNPRTAGVPIISDEADIPEGDQVISFLFKLHYADPTELQQVLGQYLSPPQPYTSFLALPKASAILITENTAVIRSLVHIIDQVDIPPAEVVSEFIKLNRADATKVVDMLKDIFEKGNQPQGQTGPGGIRAVRPNVPAPVPAAAAGENEPAGTLLTALSEDSIVVGKIKIAADVRTNRIHVITRPINMPFVRKLIAEFDANVEFAKPVTRPLRYVSAADILPVLVQALTEPGASENGQGGAGNATTPQQQQQQQRRTTGQNSSASTTDSTGGSNGGSQSFSEELSTTAVDTTPKAVTVGNAKIIADQRANAIIVLGNREVVVKVEKILDEMDVSSPQVALSTVIGSLELDNEEDFGVDYFARHNRRVAGTTNFTGIPPAVTGGTVNSSASPPTTTGGTIFNPGALGTFTQLATSAASGTNIYLAAGNSLAAVVHALNTTGKFKTISRPTVYTSNNKKAIIASGEEIPIPVNSYSTPTTVGGVISTGTAFANSSSIEYKKVALQLEVVPLINSEKYVSLDILQKIDALGTNTIVNGNTVPNIVTRYIKTNVSAPNGSTIILGGLIEDDRTTNTSGLPVLSRLPVVGALFRNTTRSKKRSELIVLMRPEVTLTQFDVARLRNKMEDKTHFGAELEADDCPDCPKPGDDKQVSPGFEDTKKLPPPDLPPASGK